MDTSRRSFLKGLLTGIGALTALPFVKAGEVKASEIFPNQPSSFEEEIAKMFLDVGEGKMSNVQAISIMGDWKDLCIKQNRYDDFTKAMQNAFGLARKTNKESWDRGFRSCCEIIIDENKFYDYCKTRPFKKTMPNLKHYPVRNDDDDEDEDID